MKNKSLQILCAFVIVIAFTSIFYSCSSTSPTQSGSYKMLYDYQSSGLHPEYVIYHYLEDSSMIYFRIRSSELLYSRTSAESPFQASFKIKSIVFDAGGNMIDSTAIAQTDYARNTSGWLIGSFAFRMNAGNYNLVVECTDMKKNVEQVNYLKADKQTSFTSQNYLILDAHTDEPLFGGFAKSDEVVKIISARNEADHQPQVSQFAGEIKLPPPPFSTSNPEVPEATAFKPLPLESDSGQHYFLVEEGVYFITSDPERKSGAILNASAVYFPEIKALTQLPVPLRYITTKVEYEDINQNYYPKKKVDDFWLECAGSKDRARDLIRIYYNRVQEANYYFSSYTEGWRTDRGMIHVVFGNPTRIVKQQTYETWIYGEEGQSGTLTFVFKKLDNLIFNNVYILNRDPAFKQHWEKQVTTWRNGRIYND